MNKKILLASGSLLVLALPGIATAHPGHDVGAGFIGGALHPLGGFDHLCALIAVGLLAARMGAGAGKSLVAIYLGLLYVGYLIGSTGLALPLVEVAIGASVLCLALLAWWPPRHLPVATSAFAGCFAIFHGHAHGSEAIDVSATAAYAAGLLIASAAVILAGAHLANLPAWNRTRLQRR